MKNTNKLEVTINTLLRKLIEDELLPEPDSYILKTKCGVDVIPSNSQLFTLERNLCNVDFREHLLARFVDTIKDSIRQFGILFLLILWHTGDGKYIIFYRTADRQRD